MEIVFHGKEGYDTPNCELYKHLNNHCNPYDEPQPFVRGRVDREGFKSGYSSIDRDNIVLQRKLKEIRTRNSEFAASDNAQAVHKACGQPHQAWQSFVHYTAHTPSRGKSPQKARAQQIAACNSVMARKLSELYGIRKDSFVVQNNLGKGLDCNERWQQRTGIYSSCCSVPQLRSGSGLRGRPSTAPPAGSRTSGLRNSNRPTSASGSTDSGSSSSCSSTGVPKTLAVALCAGCGCRSFFNADGAQLKPCPGCGHAFYCSDACRQTDYASHKAECRFHTTGRWHAAGIRPSGDCWVMNRAMTAAQRLLQQQHKQRSSCSRPRNAATRPRHAPEQPSSHQVRCRSAQPGSIHHRQQQAACKGWDGDQARECTWQQQLQQQLASVRLQGQQEALAQQQVELRASRGLDGPRPCLCASGLEQLGGCGLKAAVPSASGSGSARGAAGKTAAGTGSARDARQTQKGVCMT
ncbi:hypothetical protein COO60DRAFT_1040728 [Scenedesmus sp. NREL 46B-D3]|nr:hypothetical protein COO60DRAFT_1040728 [Scenedesmus sp. NREL 46B-D3]